MGGNEGADQGGTSLSVAAAIETVEIRAERVRSRGVVRYAEAILGQTAFYSQSSEARDRGRC